MKNEKRRFFEYVSIAVLLIVVIAFSLACGGGGGGSTPVAPTLLEGEMYLAARGHVTYDRETQQATTTEYVPVDESFDQLTLKTNDNNYISADGYQFVMSNIYGENGFILVFNQPDNANAETVLRLSVAIHPRGINLSQQTWDFINEDPTNNSFMINYIVTLLGSGGIGGGGTGTGIRGIGGALLGMVKSVSVSFQAGGTYQRVFKEGKEQEASDMYDTLIDAIAQQLGIPVGMAQLLLPEATFRQYISGLLYKSVYAGGQPVTLAQLLDMLRDSANWDALEFAASVETIVPIAGISDASAVSGNSYRITTLSPGGTSSIRGRVYSDGSSSLKFVSIPAEFKALPYIRTANADANWPANQDLLSFTLAERAIPDTVYVGIDTNLQTLPAWLSDWTVTDSFLTTTNTLLTFRVYKKSFSPEIVTLKGQGGGPYNYIVFADCGMSPFGLEMIATAHATLIQDNPEDVTSSTPSLRQEGGIKANSNGLETDLATGDTIIHADLVSEFDANAIFNTESQSPQYGVHNISDRFFVDSQILANNGFRIVDTFNDTVPVFGSGDQILLLENFLGNALPTPIAIPLREEQLQVFANMNLLNSPNLVGLYLKSISTNDPGLQSNLWMNTPGNRGLNYTAVKQALDGAVHYTYFLSDPSTPTTLADILVQLGKSTEGELSFGVLIDLASGYSIEIRAGLFIHDYFTDVYDTVLGDFLIIP